MSDIKRATDDEIDLVRLFEILWNSKLLILTVTVFTTIFSFAYVEFSKPSYALNYKVSVPYVYTLESIGSSNTSKMGFIIDPIWVMTKAQFEQTDQKPKDPVVYLSALNKMNDILTSEVLTEAQEELAFMKIAMQEMTQLASSETFILNFLSVRRLIFKIENGAKVMRFGEVYIDEIKQQPSKDNWKIVLAIFLGVLGSSAWILLRHVLNHRKSA
jgi:capsular polysaccharide biosynthesis protein